MHIQQAVLPAIEGIMVIELPDIGMSEQELRQELAITLFQQNKVSLAKAARIAGITRLDLQQLLAAREIPVHYTVADWESDERTSKALAE